MNPQQEYALFREAEALSGAMFVWGETDCALVMLQCLDAMTDGGHAARWRGRWCDLRSAAAVLRETRLDDYLASIGASRIELPFVSVGDVVVVDMGQLQGAHICLGELCITARPDQGVVLGELAALRALAGTYPMTAWRL